MPPIGHRACSGPCDREGYFPSSPRYGGVGSTEFGSMCCPLVGLGSKDSKTRTPMELSTAEEVFWGVACATATRPFS